MFGLDFDFEDVLDVLETLGFILVFYGMPLCIISGIAVGIIGLCLGSIVLCSIGLGMFLGAIGILILGSLFIE